MSTSPDALTLPQLAHEPAGNGLLGWAERGRLPDALIRLGIRRQCAERLRDEAAGGVEAQAQRHQQRLQLLQRSAVTLHAASANAQHYELPTAFFRHCLGPRMKYSCAYYPRGSETLAEAEELMLALTAERAELADGQDILELGCGWGSLTLWMAERYPHARIVAVSNSRSQREYIEAQCRQRTLHNVEVRTVEVAQLTLPARRFDRCVSVEMFEHVRNYAWLLQQISHWLRPHGKLFVHIFAHRTLLYPFEHSASDWMGRLFFSGGLMPASDTLLHFQETLRIEQQWLVDGRHYQRTANHWLENHDRHRTQVLPILADTYGEAAAVLWNQRWRMFWMACAELFGYELGQQWLVTHLKFAQRN